MERRPEYPAGAASIKSAGTGNGGFLAVFVG
jgi:hypothetical protein